MSKLKLATKITLQTYKKGYETIVGLSEIHGGYDTMSEKKMPNGCRKFELLLNNGNSFKMEFISKESCLAENDIIHIDNWGSQPQTVYEIIDAFEHLAL